MLAVAEIAGVGVLDDELDQRLAAEPSVIAQVSALSSHISGVSIVIAVSMPRLSATCSDFRALSRQSG